MRIKIVISFICFIILIITVASGLSKLFMYIGDLDDDRNRLESLYSEQKNDIDVVFIGPSSTFCSWVPLFAWHNYGITSLSFSFGHFPLSTYKYSIKEILKTQKPKVIVIQTDAIKREAFTHEEYILFHKFLLFMKFSKNRFDMINAISKECKLNIFKTLELHFPVIRYHSQYKYLINPKNIIILYKGVVSHPLFYSNGKDIPFDIHKNVIIDDENYNFPEEREKLIDDLFSYLTKLNIPVLITNFPEFSQNSDDKYYTAEILRNRFIFKMAEKHNLPYFDSKNADLIKRLEIKNTEFTDDSHFNYSGAYKYTEYFSKLLKERYNIEDKRNNKSVSASWNNAYNNYVEFVKTNYNIDLEKELYKN